MQNNHEMQKIVCSFLVFRGLALLFHLYCAGEVRGGDLLRKPMKSPLNGVAEIA